MNRQTKILTLLLENRNNKGGFMTTSDIAKNLYGEAYVRRTAHDLDQMIKESMQHVKELAEEDGLLVIPLRQPTQGDKEKRFRIIGWKIATTDDQKYIEQELLFKVNNTQARKLSTERFTDIAIKQGVLPKEKLKELTQ